MSRPVRPAPRHFSDHWPDSECSDQVAEVARLLAIKLRVVTDKYGVREVARRAGVSSSIISRTINGESWVDTATLARLELTLGVDLWPRRPRTSQRPTV
jgi:transcriptional regulator with XRE-family HTH domain